MANNDRSDEGVVDPFLEELSDRARGSLRPFDSAEGWAVIAEQVTAGARQRQVVPMTRRYLQWPFLSVAASTLLLAGLGAYAWHTRGLASARQIYATVPGQRMNVVLKDGTRVTLAPASRLQLASDYDGSARHLTLVGEAYFSVVHDVEHPFIVQIDRATVTDVGTEFDVRAYANDPMRVAVTAGQVMIASADGRSDESSLHAGDVAAIGQSGVAVIHHADVASLTEWRQGGLAFDNAALPAVVHELSRTFDLDIVIADTTLAKQTITARFNNGTANQILDEITQVIGARYDRHGRTVVIRRRPDVIPSPSSDPAPPTLRTARANTSPE